MTWRTRLAYIAAFISLIVGFFGLLLPDATARLVGLAVAEPRGWGDIRATYGGLFLVLGSYLLWAIPRRPATRSLLTFAAMLWLGAAGGRLFSVLWDIVLAPMNLVVFLLELAIGLAILASALETPVKPVVGRQ
jgi:hypothetical protein